METRKWTNPITNIVEEVEIGSNRDKELMQKLRDTGLWAPSYPGEPQPEGLMTMDEYLQKHRRNEETGKIEKKDI